MYTYKDRKLTKEQVDKLAAEKGVEVDVFLTNNPDIQIQEAVVETTESEGKTSTTETDTTVDAIEVSESTESPLEPGSSGFTEEGEIILSGEEVEKGSVALEPVALEEVVVTGEKKKEKKIEEGYGLDNYLYDSFKKGDAFLGESLVSLPGTLFSLAALVSDPVNRALGFPETNVKKFEESIGTRPIIESLIEEQRGLGEKLNVYEKSKNIKGGAYDNFSKGNFSDGFIKLGRGLGESAPISISMMMGGAAGATRLRMISTATPVLAGPELKTQREENPNQSEVENVMKAFSIAGAESFFEGIGSGTLGKVYKDIIFKQGKEKGAETFRAGLISMYETALKRYGVPVSFLGGGIEEVATNTTQNIINGKNAFEGNAEAFTQGVGGGALYGSPVNLAKGVNAIKSAISETKVNSILKSSNFELRDVQAAFNPKEFTTEAQVELVKDKNTYKVLDSKLKRSVDNGDITNEQADAVRINFRETQGAVNQIKPLKLSTKDQAKAVQLMKEKKQLSNQIKQVGEANLTVEQSDRIKEIDQELKGIGSKAVTQEVEKVKKAAENIKDLDVQEFASTEETEAFLNEQGQDPKASGQQGFIIQNPKTGKQTIVINREIADKEIAVAAPSHEFLHALLFQTVKNSPETQLALGNSLKEYINKIDANKVKDSNFAERLKQYKSDPEAVQAEEVLTLFSDAIRTEDIKFNEGVFTKIGDVVRKALQALGVKVKFNNGKDVYNFIKDYNKSLESTGLTKAQVKAAEGVTGKLVADKIQTDEQIVKESRSEEASAKVQELYDLQGEAAAFDIIEQFKPITSKIVEKRSQAPGFDRQLLTDEIETGKRGILDLVREYDAESGVPLAAYINKFLPARAIEASKRILGEEFTDDVTEAKGVAAEEVSVDVAPTDKSTTSKLRRVLGIKQGDAIYDLAKEVSGEILSGDLPGKKVKTAINKEARKSKLRKAVSDLMGTEKAIDEQFLNKNILEILKALPASDLVKLEREAKVKVLAEQGPRLNVKDAREAVNKGLLPKDTNLQSGPKVSFKLPTTLEQAKEFFTQKRKQGLVNVITEMLVKDAAPEVTEGKMEPAKRAKVLSEIDRLPTLKFSKTAETALDRPLFELEEKVVDELLEKYNQQKTFKYKTKEQVDEAIKEIEKELLPLMPKDFWFGKPDSKGNYGTAFTPSSKVFGTTEKAKDLYKNYWTTEIKKLRNLPDSAFGKKIPGINDFSKSSYSTIFKNEATIKKNIKNGNIDKFNDKISKIHEAFWKRIYDKIQNNPKSATVIANYLKMVGSDTSHWHKLGAKFVGYSKNPSGRYEYEHAMPATAAYLYLLDASLSGANFNAAYAAVMDNYKLIALDKVMDKKLTAVGLQRKMPKGWKLLDNFWWQRYFNEEVAAIDGGIPTNSLIFLNGKDATQELKVDSAGNATTPAIQKSVSKASKSNNKILPSDFRLTGDFNNQAVLDRMSEIDNTSQEAELKFSKSLDLNKDFNDIIENKTGIASDKTYARVKAEVAGANKGKFNFFIPPSAEDFLGLLYSTLGKGDVGTAQMAWYKAHLLNPFARAMENLANDRVSMMQDYRGLKKALKIVPKDLRKKIKDSNFTKEQAVRVAIWDKQGMAVPGLSQKDQKELVDFVNADAELTTFADQLIAINKGDEYASPEAGWVAGTIDTDFIKSLNTTKRSKYLEVWQQNVDQIFSEANLNKLETAYGKAYRVAMENMLHRMKTGRNRSFGTDTITSRFTDWLTNSVGAIMFFNTRSAVLQTISAVNFINFTDNNVLKAGLAFANQPQYWSDFKKLFNSPFLLDRRSGIKLNVNEADIAEMAKGPGNSARNVVAGLLKLGFLPTQIADSFAIASGGATFYRNRIKALMKEGLTEAEAEEIAFRDFREIAEESQQSSRPDKISQQQAGPLGRIVLAFANTPAQYARLIKKAASDLKNGRGDAKTNISKIIYYGVAQNLLFSALQQALFAIGFGDEDEEEEKRNEKYFNIANGMADSILRGIGVGGAVVSVVKNTAIRLAKEADKKAPKYQDAVVKGVLQISPPVSSKVSKLQSAGRSFSWNQEEMKTMGWSIDNPAYLASAQVISAITNVPLDRAIKKITNIKDAGNENIEYYKRVALALGWSAWELGIKKDSKGKVKKVEPKTDMDKLYDLNKKQQIDSLLSLGLSKKQIKALKLEEDRVKAILDPKSIKKIKVSKKDSLFGLNKKDQVKALEKLGLTKKEIRALRLESDRVEAIINKQKQEN